MHSIAVIGAGQLGSRHLQGLCRLALPCEIAVVDPSADSLALARSRFDEMPANVSVRSVSFLRSVDELPPVLDYVVVATTADVRLNVLQALLRQSDVRYMLLEKVLFQRIGDYAIAGALLEAQGVRAWVNCARRVFPIYAFIKTFFGTDTLIDFRVAGGGWGLGCNSVHFLDLLGMLTGALTSTVSNRELDSTLIASKRANFFEFTGSLRGSLGTTRFELTSFSGSSARLVLTFRSESRVCVVDEVAGQAFLFDSSSGQRWQEREFTLPLISNVATDVATRILLDGTSELPTFEQSCAYHLPLLQSLAEHASACQGTEPDFCPIT